MTLKDVLPASYRKIVYTVYAVVGFIIGATQVGYATASEGQPEWLLVALAVFGYTGVALGVVAGANTPAVDGPVDVNLVGAQPRRNEVGAFSVVQALAVAILAVVLIYLLSLLL